MRRKKLEILLQSIPHHPSLNPRIEPYSTPAPLGAEILFHAYSLGDVKGKVVLDLGCGTGIFAIGALLLGASFARGVDIDSDAIAIAQREAERLGVSSRLELEVEDVASVTHPSDVCFMNPPFGNQSPGADRPFFEAAFRSSPVVYAFHHRGALPLVQERAKKAGAMITHLWERALPLPARLPFHDRTIQGTEVIVARIVTLEEE